MLFEIIESYTNCDFEEVPESINLAGVTMENRQSLIAQLDPYTPILLVRDPYNQYDKYAIAVKTIVGDMIGWVPRQYASILSPEIDSGISWYGKIDRVLGNEETLRGVSVKLFHSC